MTAIMKVLLTNELEDTINQETEFFRRIGLKYTFNKLLCVSLSLSQILVLWVTSKGVCHYSL